MALWTLGIGACFAAPTPHPEHDAAAVGGEMAGVQDATGDAAGQDTWTASNPGEDALGAVDALGMADAGWDGLRDAAADGVQGDGLSGPDDAPAGPDASVQGDGEPEGGAEPVEGSWPRGARGGR